MTNKFLARGISKETGKFVYGYYVKIEKRHYLMETKTAPLFEKGCLMVKDWLTEITKEPDRCTTYLDKNKKPIYENDKIRQVIPFSFSFDKKKPQEILEFVAEWSLTIRDSRQMKIIGNTHNIKEQV